MSSAARTAWQLAFQSSPIALSGGLFSSVPGLIVPILAFTEAINFPLGLLSGGDAGNPDNFFAQFEPVSGATIIDQQLGRYPFANQAIAANATIAQPLTFSMRMTCPVRDSFGYYERFAVITALQYALTQHNTLGGVYHVLTPSYLYTNCILKTMRDASSGQTKQPQHAWMLDFEQPLLTLSQAQSAQNSLFSMFTNAVNPATTSPSGLAAQLGGSTGIASPSLIPAGSSSISVTALSPLPGIPAMGFNAGIGPT